MCTPRLLVGAHQPTSVGAHGLMFVGARCWRLPSLRPDAGPGVERTEKMPRTVLKVRKPPALPAIDVRDGNGQRMPAGAASLTRRPGLSFWTLFARVQ
jgi:hypothetical protein